MTLVAEKTWGKVLLGPIWNSNVDYNNRALLYWIKYGLIRNYDNSGVGGAGAWTVVGSSDSITAGMDTVDRWTDESKLVWNSDGLAHSWIVLKQTGINAGGSGFQMCIDLNDISTDSEYITVVVSYSSGFTGGAITNRPTATTADQFVLINNGLWGPNIKEGGTRKLVVCKTSDGACNRVYISFDSTFRSMWFLDLPQNYPIEWTTPLFAKVNINPTYANLSNALGIQVPVNGYLRSAYAFCEGDSTGPLTENVIYQRPDALGNWIALPIGVAVENTTSHGYLGNFYDFWFIASSLPDGDYVRGTGEPWYFIILSDVVQPYDGEVFRGLI